MLLKQIAHYIILVSGAILSNLLLTNIIEQHNYQISQNVLYAYGAIILITIIILVLLQYFIQHRHLKNLIIFFTAFILIIFVSSALFTQNILNVTLTLGLVLIINRNFLIVKEEEKTQIVSNFWSYIGFTLIITLAMISTEMFFMTLAYLLVNLYTTLSLDKKVTENKIEFYQASLRSTYTIIATTIILLLVG